MNVAELKRAGKIKPAVRKTLILYIKNVFHETYTTGEEARPQNTLSMQKIRKGAFIY